jgi:hypothetical protein
MPHLYFFISLLIVGFGQPAASSMLALFAATVAKALFWKLLPDIPSSKNCFWLSTP